MSTPQQPWSPGPPDPSAPSGYGAPSGDGHQSGSGTPSAYGAPLSQQGQAPVQPQPPSNGPTGELVIDLRKPLGAMGMISPVVTIDGFPAPCSWGRNVFVAPAGTRRVDVAQSYMWTYGRATLPVQVAPGSSVVVHYAGPMLTFMGGAIGLEPQRRPAQGVFVGLMVFVAVVLLIGILAAVLGNA